MHVAISANQMLWPGQRRMRRRGGVLALVAGVTVAALTVGVNSAGAQDDTTGKTLLGKVEESPPEINGKRAPKIPFEGVTIVVSRAGKQQATTKTDADGKYEVELPSAGDYEVTLDAETLPVGKSVRSDGRNPVTFNTEDSRSSLVIKNFPIEENPSMPIKFRWGTLLDRLVEIIRQMLSEPGADTA